MFGFVKIYSIENMIFKEIVRSKSSIHFSYFRSARVLSGDTDCPRRKPVLSATIPSPISLVISVHTTISPQRTPIEGNESCSHLNCVQRIIAFGDLKGHTTMRNITLIIEK